MVTGNLLTAQKNNSNSSGQLSLCEVLDGAKKKWDIRFGYDRELFSTIQVPAVYQNLDPEELVKVLAQDYGIQVNALSKQHILLRPEQNNKSGMSHVWTISGNVYDAETGDPLVGASVYSSDLSTGVITEEDGGYILRLNSAPSEAVYILVRYLGYEVQSVVIREGQVGEEYNFKLTPAVTQVASITVKSTMPLIQKLQPGNYTVRTEKSLLVNGPMGNDPLRQLQLLPGVAAFDDLSGQPKVRGASVEGNQFLLNGMTLLNVDHFFGIYSAINPYIIDQISLHKTYFPINYGGRSSAVIALNSTPHPAPLEGVMEVSPLTANAVLRGNIKSKFSFIAGGRTSVSNLGQNSLYQQLYQEPVVLNTIRNSENLEVRPAFRFNDGYLQLGYKGKKDSLSVQWYESYDRSAFAYTNTFVQRFFRDTIQLHESFDEESRWRNKAWSIGYSVDWTPRWNSGWYIGQSRYEKTDVSQLNFYSFRPRPNENSELQTIDNNFNNQVNIWQLRWYNKWFVSPQVSLDGGLEGEQLKLNNILQTNFAEQLISTDDQSWNYSAWSGLNYQGSRWSWSAGLRMVYDQQTTQLRPSPRLNLSYTLNDQWRCYALAGIYPQWMRTSLHESAFNQTYQFWVLADQRKIPILSAQKTAVGAIFSKGPWEVQTELFYDHYDGLVQHVLAAPGVKIPGENILPRYRLFTGKGATFGADVWIKAEWKKYLGWFSYTWSKANQSYVQLNQGRAFPAEDDRRHQLKWINTLALGRFNFNWSMIYASGKPYLDYQALRINNQDRGGIDLNRLTRYLEPYRRVDVGVSYKQPWCKSNLTASVSVYNLFDATNVKYNQFIYGVTDSGRKDIFTDSYVAGQTITLLPFTPSLALKWQF